MANLAVQVNRKDLKRLQNKFGNIKRFIDTQMMDGVKHEADIVVNEMKQEVPVDTGRLKRNIHAFRKTKDIVTIDSEAISSSGDRRDYAPIIENYGGRFQKGIYYWSNGIVRLRGRITNYIRTGVRSVLSSNKSGSTRQRGNVRTYTPRR